MLTDTSPNAFSPALVGYDQLGERSWERRLSKCDSHEREGTTIFAHPRAEDRLP